MFDVALDAALEVEAVALAGGFVFQVGMDAFCQIGGVPQAVQDGIVIELDRLEDLLVRVESDLGAGAVGLPVDFRSPCGTPFAYSCCQILPLVVDSN